MFKNSSCILAATIFSLAYTGAVQAAPPLEGEATAREGVLRCGFNYRLRFNDTELLRTFIVLRNVDSTEPIVIDRLRFFDAQGEVLFDSAISGELPSSTNSTLGPNNNTLNPNQTGQFEGSEIPGMLVLGQNARPGQVEIRWSAGRRGALALQGNTTRVSQARDSNTGALLAERSRTDATCRTIFLR